MAEKELDILGKVCPFCLLAVKKEVATMASGDVLNVLCDHPPAANETIPFAMKQEGNAVETEKIQPGLWKIKITKK